MIVTAETLSSSSAEFAFKEYANLCDLCAFAYLLRSIVTAFDRDQIVNRQIF
jgi:hypothetical protein